MSDVATFTIQLKEIVSGPAKKAAEGVAALTKEVKEHAKSVAKEDAANAKRSAKSLADANKRASAEADAARKGFAKKLADQNAFDRDVAKRQRKAMADTQKEMDRYWAKQTKDSEARAKAAASTKTGGPSTGGVGIGGLSESVVALGAVAAAFAAATAAATAFAFKIADEKRSLMLNYEAMLGSSEAAKQLDASITELSTHTPVSKDRLEDMAKGLVKAHLSGADLTNTMQALATAEAATGDSTASDAMMAIIRNSQAGGIFKASVKQMGSAGIELKSVLEAIAKNSGKSMAQVEQDFAKGKISASEGIAGINAAVQGSKMGDVAGRQMLGLSVQFDKFGSAVKDMFEGVNIEPFLVGLQSVTSLFNENTATGKAMGSVVQSIFGGIASVLGFVMPLVKQFIVGFMIGFLKIKIAMAPVFAQLQKVFGTASGGQALAKVFRFIGEAVAFVIPVVAGVVSGFLTVGAAIYGIVTAAQSAWEGLKSFASGFVEIGTSIVQGIIDGVASGAGMLWDALAGLGSQAWDAFKGALGIASPSKVFKMGGKHIAEGAKQGVEANAPSVNQAVASMVQVPDVKQAGGSSSSTSVGGITINISGVQGAEQLKEILPRLLAQAFEQAGMQMGVT